MEQRVAALVDFYRRVQTERMQGVPILNLALSVEAVGFRRAETPEDAPEPEHEPVAEGVLITPWFMSLVRLPLALQPHGNRVARKFVRDFGSEGFEFIGAHDDAVGYHETCALFSPMDGFATQAQAVETALASLALVRPELAKEVVKASEPVPARRAFFMARRNGPGATP
ncbi:[NiFe]-hydrogenase assembly chaperone HybE [Hydrogenophaga sp. RWCD_12]|uniref:[NiFe]-hydrogenase assembly chaperone HybE n=1 Tax=Hydrogenophaga sp. RWCD_12 TaxID=3391190 RepID=UPI003985401A